MFANLLSADANILLDLPLREILLHYYETYHPWVEMVGVLLAIVALAFALKQLRDSQRLIKEAADTARKSGELFERVQDINKVSKELSDRVKEIGIESDQLIVRVGDITNETKTIKDELSTKFVSFFPYNLEAITKLISSASSTVDIMVDIVGYGHYSAPEKFLDYEKKLKELANASHVQLRMLVYGQSLTERSRDEQFGGADNFREIVSSKPFHHYFREVYKGLSEPTDYNSFIARLDKEERGYEEKVRGLGALIGSCDSPFRFFLWLVDKTEAAFSFQMYGEHFDELCFRTRDGHMINMFNRLFCDAWAEWERKNPTMQTATNVAGPAGSDLTITPPPTVPPPLPPAAGEA